MAFFDIFGGEDRKRVMTREESVKIINEFEEGSELVDVYVAFYENLNQPFNLKGYNNANAINQTDWDFSFMSIWHNYYGGPVPDTHPNTAGFKAGSITPSHNYYGSAIIIPNLVMIDDVNFYSDVPENIRVFNYDFQSDHITQCKPILNYLENYVILNDSSNYAQYDNIIDYLWSQGGYQIKRNCYESLYLDLSTFQQMNENFGGIDKLIAFYAYSFYANPTLTLIDAIDAKLYMNYFGKLKPGSSDQKGKDICYCIAAVPYVSNYETIYFNNGALNLYAFENAVWFFAKNQYDNINNSYLRVGVENIRCFPNLNLWNYSAEESSWIEYNEGGHYNDAEQHPGATTNPTPPVRLDAHGSGIYVYYYNWIDNISTIRRPFKDVFYKQFLDNFRNEESGRCQILFIVF